MNEMFKLRKMYKAFKVLMSFLPVSVSSIADPTHQVGSTKEKMEKLIEAGHKGPVALITKGDWSKEPWKVLLERWAKELNLFVFASISHLPQEIERANEDGRYRTLEEASEAGAKAIAYIRPLISKINDDEETLREMLRRAKEAKAICVVASRGRAKKTDGLSYVGLEGTEPLINQFWDAERKVDYDVEVLLPQIAEKVDMPYFSRTGCAVAYLSGLEHSYKPYYLSPQFSGCANCPLKTTCIDKTSERTPTSDSLKLLKYLGYELEFRPASDEFSGCKIYRCQRHTGDSCCKTCDSIVERGAPCIDVFNNGLGKVPSLGDISFIRFLTGGMLVFSSTQRKPSTDPLVYFRRHCGGNRLYAKNSWLAWGDGLPWENCFGCSYCFLKRYYGRGLSEPLKLRETVGNCPVYTLW